MKVRFEISLGLVFITGVGFLAIGFYATPWVLRLVASAIGLVVLLPALLLLVWLLEAKRKRIITDLRMETWIVADDGEHNAFTDMLIWQDDFWLVYVSSPSHFASKKSRVVLLRSSDARNWQEVKKFDGAGQDIRDPKLGIIQGQLFLYALLNKQFDPAPYQTIAAHSKNGLDWTPFEVVMAEGWLLGRSITQDDMAWYAPAHHIDQGTVVVLRSNDGLDWNIQSTIFTGNDEHADETALHFLKDGGMVAVSRLEAGSAIFGSEKAATLISTTAPPFQTWAQLARNTDNRLDSPNLFSVNDKLYVVGRFQPRLNSAARNVKNSNSRNGLGLIFTKQQGNGSAFSQKRTAVFLVDEKTGNLMHLTDLPSAGDTAYAGVAIKDEKLFISYYTSDPYRDYPWLLGMLLPSRIQISMLDLVNLQTQKDER